MFGAHLSTAGGMVNALNEARRLRMDCVQVFTANQRQWASRPLGAEALREWRDRLRELRWTRSARVVSHGAYLVNLASPDRDLRNRSLARQREELERCEMLSIRSCVIHPGAHMGAARPAGEPHELGRDPRRDELAGLKRLVGALDQLHRWLPGYRVLTCLETTAGAGTTLGYDFRHLAFVRESVREPERVGFCFDTCHVTAAGYDMSHPRGAREVLRLFGATCGARHLRVFHLNDSAAPLGTRRDRHAHIGHGYCGLACFRAIVNSPRFARVPKILETPKGTDSRGVPWDVANIRRLKRLKSP